MQRPRWFNSTEYDFPRAVSPVNIQHMDPYKQDGATGSSLTAVIYASLAHPLVKR